MSVFAKTLSDVRYICKSAIILRLCKKINCKSYCSYYLERTLTGVQRFPESYIRLFLCRNLTSVVGQEEKNASDAKIPVDFPTEHAHMHKLLENSAHYSKTIASPIIVKTFITDEEAEKLLDSEWSSANAFDAYNAVRKISYNCLHSGKYFDAEKYKHILNALSTKLSNLDDRQLMRLLQYIQPFQKQIFRLDAYRIFMQAVNKECFIRFYGSNVDKMLLVCDLLYQLRESTCEFSWRALRKIASKPQKLTPKTLVHLLFLLSESPRTNINMYNLEYRLEECIDDLTANEIGIVSRGFFRNKTQIKNAELLNKILKKVTAGIDTIDNINLAATMKLIRYGTNLKEISVFRLLLTALQSHLPRVSFLCLTHIAHAAANIVLYEKDIMDVIIERLINEIGCIRLKDIERILYSICMICPEAGDHPVYQAVVQELVTTFKTTRAKEIQMHQKTLPRILMQLSYKNIYPQELLEHILNPEYIKTCYRNTYDLSNEIWRLNCCLHVEVPSYTGPFCSEKLIKNSLKKFYYGCEEYNRTRDYTRMFITEVVYTLNKTLESNVHVGRVLPHFGLPDLIIGLDEHNNVTPVEDILSEMQDGTIKRVDSDDLRKITWKALVLIPSKQIVKGTNLYVGHTYAKLRQLQAVGYTPITISEIEWHTFKDEAQKQKYLKDLILGESKLNVTCQSELS